MADSSVPITAGTGTSVDTRTESTNGNHRQVVVIGDPATNAGVAPVDATKGLAVDLSATGANTNKLLVTPDLPSGASTSAKQDTGNTSLSSIDSKITAVNTGAVVVSSSALPTGAATAAKQPALGTAGTASADVITVQGKASMTPLLVDPSGVTSPVSLASVPSHAVTNAGTFATQATLQANTGVDIGKLTANQSVNVAQMNGTTVTMGNGTAGTGVQRVTLASDSTGQVALAAGSATIGALTANQTVNNAQINGTTPLMGNGTTGTGSQRVTIASDNTAFSVNAVQSGTWTVQPGNTPNSTPWLVTDTPATSGGLSIVTGSVGATATAIKASAGQLFGYHLFNTTAAVAYVQIFNTAAASVTLGTTPPVISIGIPASGGVTVNFDKGIAFGTAISFGCTTTRAGSSGATVDCNFFYK